MQFSTRYSYNISTKQPTFEELYRICKKISDKGVRRQTVYKQPNKLYGEKVKVLVIKESN